jgi:hypothetical protein
VGESEKAGFHLSFQRAPGHQPPTWPDLFAWLLEAMLERVGFEIRDR